MTDMGPTTGAIEVEAPIRRETDEILAARREVTVSRQGTLAPVNLAQQLEVSQMMAKASFAVPAHLRANPGACLAVLEFANGWGLMAYAVANKSYVVNDRLCFESQLIHAVIEMHAPLYEDNLHFEFVGEGDARRCRVWAQCKVRGKVQTLVWEGTEIGKIHPKNSPLWKSKPDLQSFYNSSRDWARVYFPHILLGAYTKEEFEDSPDAAEAAKDVSPKGTRLKGSAGRDGFQASNVEVIRTAQGSTGAPSELDMIAADEQYSNSRRMGPIGKEVVQAGQLQSVASEGSEKTIATQPQPPQSEAGAEKATGGIEAAAKAETAEAKKRGQKDKPTEVEPPKPTAPRTPEEYITHLKAWVGKTTDDAYILDRWMDEKGLRTKCSVIGEHFNAAQMIKEQRLVEI